MAPSVLLLDIEGTTTSISFVKDILFPFVSKSLVQYLNDNWNEVSLHDDIELLRNDALDAHRNGNLDIPLIPSPDRANDEEVIKRAIIKNVKYQMSIDRKSNSLKNLQGHIWFKGYEKKELIGHVYQDVPRAFERWTKKGIKLYIYSSGSVDAQKLLFGHTNYGNLLTYISGHFDLTNIGTKVESSSYSRILKELNTASENVLFLTDVLKEAEASKSAGIESVIVIRPGNHLIESVLDRFRTITTFDELDEIVFEKINN